MAVQSKDRVQNAQRLFHNTLCFFKKWLNELKIGCINHKWYKVSIICHQTLKQPYFQDILI